MLSFTVQHGSLRPRKTSAPRLRPGWALVRVRLAGICNTDLEILRGYHDFRGTPGHEFVGEVVRVAGVRNREARGWVGRRVVGEINIACASLGYRPCAYCRRGIPNHCLRRRVLGIVAHDGAFAEFLALPLRNLHRVPESVGDGAAVFAEPLAAACEILGQVRVREHREAALLGDGKLAQLIAQVLRAEGRRVVMFGKYEEKLALARAAGVATFHMKHSTSRMGAARQYSLVVEATGSPSGFALAQELTAPRGTLVLKSTFHGPASIETWPIVVKEITLVGSRCGPFSRALRMLQSGSVDPRPLVSRVFPLGDAPAAIRCAARHGVLKVLLRP